MEHLFCEMLYVCCATTIVLFHYKIQMILAQTSYGYNYSTYPLKLKIICLFIMLLYKNNIVERTD
jgi:hypothetical protein